MSFVKIMSHCIHVYAHCVCMYVSSRETELLAEITHLEILNAKLHEELTKKTLLVQELTSKGELYDSLHTRASKLDDECSQLRQKDLVQSLTIRSLQEERESFQSRNNQLEQSQDLLRMDKMYLTKETERLNDCYRDCQRNIERLDIKNMELKKQKEDLVEKLVKVREEHQQSYEEKLSVSNNHMHIRTYIQMNTRSNRY
jgi:chromosome segregation ATPase